MDCTRKIEDDIKLNHLESKAGALGYFLLLGNEINVRFLELPSQSTGRAFLLCNREENLGDHIF